MAEIAAEPLYVVAWRTKRGKRLQVQPFVYGAAAAANVARKLVKSYAGEAFTLPITIPDDEDPLEWTR